MTELKNAGEPIPIENTVPSKCPLSEDLDRPEPVEDLVRCPEYRELSCCSKREDKILDDDFVSAYEYIYSGCEGCLENFRLLQCAMRCSPNQLDFATLATQAEDLKRDLKARVRVCPQTCSRFFASCVNTTSRHVFHADDATFCASQGNSADGIQFVVDANSCINTAGPSFCNGDYIHETSEDDSLSTRQIVKLVSLIAVLLFTLCGGIYMLCTKGPEDEILTEVIKGQKVLTTPTPKNGKEGV